MNKIVLWPNPILSKGSDRLGLKSSDDQEQHPYLYTEEQLKQLVDNMYHSMTAYGGVGLSAIQINVPVQLVTSCAGGKYQFFINPEITSTGMESEPMAEGCLSLPGIVQEVNRCKTVTVSYQETLDGERKVENFEGLMAQVLAHEIDHLNGITMMDKVSSAVRQNVRGELAKRKRMGQLRNYQ